MWYMWYIVWMYHNLWYIIQSKLYNLLFSSLFWAPDHLFCATLVPQIVPQFMALVAQSFFCATYYGTFCGTYFLYFTCDPFYSSHFWIPDPLFCGTNSATICGTCGTKFFVPQKVPQIEGHEAHNLPVPCSSIPFLYYRLLTRPLPSLPYSSSTSYLIHPIPPTLPYSTSTHLFMLYSI